MNFYKVLIGDNIFEYHYLTDTSNLIELNKHIDGYPKLNNSDAEVLRSGGGTGLYLEKNPEVFIYIINIDFVLYEDGYKIFDNYLYEKFESIRKSIKRDMKINLII